MSVKNLNGEFYNKFIVKGKKFFHEITKNIFGNLVEICFS